MFLPLAVFLALFLLWSVYWFIASTMAQASMNEQRSRLKQMGITLDCAKEKWSGYPFRFEFTCTSPVVKMRQDISASSASFLVVALAYNPSQAVVLLDGPTAIDGSGFLPLKLTHGRIIASATFVRDGEIQLSADIPDLKVPGLLTSTRTILHMRPSPAGVADVAASVTQFSYQPDGRPPLIIDQGNLLGTLKVDRTFSVSKIDLSKGATHYWGTGDVKLDQQHRIAGQLATETNDIDGLLKILEPHLMITDQQKSNLRMMLGLLGKQARADIIARDGQLYVGPFKVADLIPLY